MEESRSVCIGPKTNARQQRIAIRYVPYANANKAHTHTLSNTLITHTHSYLHTTIKPGLRMDRSENVKYKFNSSMDSNFAGEERKSSYIYPTGFFPE